MKIEHIAVYVDNLENAKKFFMNYFGAVSNEMYHNKNKGFKSYFLTFDDGARLEIMNKAGISDKNNQINRLGYNHIAFSAGSRENVDRLTAKLKNDGYEVLSGPRVTGDGYYESSIIAFEGNIIEITV